MIDTAALLARVDLLAMVERDLGPARRHRSGSPRALFLCPFHGDNHPSLEVNLRKGKVFCNVCGVGLDAIGWTMKFHKLNFREACQRLGAEDDGRHTAPTATQPAEPANVLPPNEPPSPTWQKQAWEVSAEASEALHSTAGERALAWLMEKRGLKLGTINYWMLGYLPADRYPNPVTWGLPRDVRLWLPGGIVIPCVVGEVLWGLHVRRPVGAPKYVHVSGSRKALHGADTLSGRRVVALTEGEFDDMVIWQEARELVGSGSPTTGAGSFWQSDWTVHLFDAEAILICYDADSAGKQGAREKLAPLSSRMALCPPPGGKDVTDFYMGGGDVNQWLAAERWKALDNDPANLQTRLQALANQASRLLLADLKADLAHSLNGR